VLNTIAQGTVTTVNGFLAGATCAGIKDKGNLDLGILYSLAPCTAAGVFTNNKAKSPPVVLSQQHLAKRQAQAIIVNSGCANTSMGKQGQADARKMAEIAATKLGISSQEVLVASTGIIGTPLPIGNIQSSIGRITLKQDGGHELARAMMTTDTRPKEIAIQFNMQEHKVTIGGVAKGAGMIHPNMATMLSFIVTDARVNADFLQAALRQAVDVSFNMISIDGDTSTSDCVFLLASGSAGNLTIGLDNGELFQEALTNVCLHLAKSIVQDAEGATKLLEVTVEGARNLVEARQAARTIVSSTSVKTAIHGNDPNWGRIITALGNSQTDIVADSIDIYLDNTCVLKGGTPVHFDREKIKSAWHLTDSASIKLSLNMGHATATAWGCDLSEEYVTINSEYTT
jgi:glutamate N-acetyltransferase/amino-acid N-acetyltransferase